MIFRSDRVCKSSLPFNAFKTHKQYLEMRSDVHNKICSCHFLKGCKGSGRGRGRSEYGENDAMTT